MDKYKNTLSIFEKNYVLVPLEVFGKDPYKTLISTVLSARTNDDTTLLAANRLFDRAPDISSLSQLTNMEISELIYPVGFYKTKAKHLQALSKKVLKDFKGRVPNTREELMSLPGVGRKTANLVLNRAFDIPAIAVDTHVHHLTNILGWVETKKPEETEKALEKSVPQKYWKDMNRLFVSIGRQFRSKRKLYEFLKSNRLISKDPTLP